MLKVLRDLPITRNQALKPADDEYNKLSKIKATKLERFRRN